MIVRLASLALAALLLAGGPALAATKDERRQEVRDTAASTLERLYKSQPKAKVAVERSAGYAVFSNVGVKIFVAGGGQGAEIFAGAMSVSPGVWLYQLTDDGLAAELTVKGTRYYVDSELN